MKWQKVKLGDVCRFIQTGPFGSQLHMSDYSETGTPFVMPKDIKNGVIITDGVARVEKEHVDRLSRHKFEVGDIVFPRRGDVGKCALITTREAGWLCGSGCFKVSLDQGIVNPKFLSYLLLQPDKISWLEKNAVGATMPNINSGILGSMPIEIPHLTIQNRIVSLLSAYDELIEVNKRQIVLLEEVAMRLYKDWFVNLRFPGHESTHIIDGLPQGWKNEKFGASITYERGVSYSSEEINTLSGVALVNLANIASFGGFNVSGLKRYAGKYRTNQVVEEGDLILGITDMTQDRRTVGAVALIPSFSEKAVISADLLKVITDLPKNFIYCMFRFGGYSKYISQFANGANVLHLKPSQIDNVDFVKPSESLMLKFDDLVNPMFREINTRMESITKLQQARDAILPKLMSGKIDVEHLMS